MSDATSGELLPGAHVYLPDVRLGTTTNGAGYFAIPRLPVTTYRVGVSFVGFASRDTLIRAEPSAAAVIKLRPITFETPAAEVEADQGVPYAVEPGVMRVPTEALQRLPGAPGEADLLHGLRWIPGVQRAGASASGLVVRGGAPDQNLFLLDGAPVYHPWHAFSLVSTFHSEAFKNVRLYRGSFPAEYGGRLSAVLDAEMKDGNRSNISTTVALGALSARALLEMPLNDRWSYMVSARRSYIDRIIGTTHLVESGGVQDTMRTGYYFLDLSSKVTWRPTPSQKLSFSVYGGRDAWDLRLPFDITADLTSSLRLRDWLRPSDLYFELDTNWGNYVFNLRYQWLFSEQLFLTAAAYSSSYYARERTYIQPITSSAVSSWYTVDLHDKGVKVDVDYYPSPTHQVRTGIRLVHRSFRSELDATIRRSPGAVDQSDQDSRLYAAELVAYVQDTWQPTAELQIQPGIRASILSGGARLLVDPRIGVRYDGGRFILRAFLRRASPVRPPHS